jgi:hypothetical protein
MKPAESSGRSVEGAYQTTDKFTSLEVHSPSGSEDGDNSLSQGIRNEPEPNTQLGEDGESASNTNIGIVDGDSLVNVEQTIANFKKLAGLRLRGDTPKMYEQIFRRFAEAANLEQYTRRQLAGNKGKELLIGFLLDKSKVPEPSRQKYNSGLKVVWTEGLNLPYPITRRHLGELPEVQTRQSPRDSVVIPWINALEHEEEPFLKALVLMIFQLGVRPSHACLFRWKHVSFGMDGKPEMIMTTGREPGNKRMTPIKARLPPDLVEALIELRKVIPNAMPEYPILPHRKKDGQFERNIPMKRELYAIQWYRFKRKHVLNHLRPVDLRHWVATTCRKAGLSLPARNALQGHKFNGENQGERYDNPQDIDILEEQARILPYGPIGFICPKMEVTQALPVELTEALSSCLNGEIMPSMLQEKVTAYLVRQIKKPANTMIA